MKEFMDQNSKISIDLDYALKKIDVKTPYGLNMKDSMKPFRIGEEHLLRAEFKLINNILEKMRNDKETFKRIQDIFGHIKDLRGSVSRAIDKNVLTEVELFEIKVFVLTLKDLSEEIEEFRDKLLGDITIERIMELEKLLDPQNKGHKTFYIYEEYSEELKDIRRKRKELESRIKVIRKSIKEDIEHELNVKFKLDGSIIVSKSDTELIEKLKNHPHLAYSSETYLDLKYSLQFIPELDTLEKELSSTKDSEEKEELRIKQELTIEIAKHSKDIYRNMDSIGKLDLIIAKAHMAISIDGVMPNISTEPTISIVDGRHLKVADTLKDKSQAFTPITVNLKQGVTCITGANMGGKTVSLKLMGLLCAMAQYGLFVPAIKMEMGLLDFIHVSIGDSQSTDQGLSTFGAEIKSVSYAISRAHERGFVLVDELARGTNPQEGYSISKAIVNHLKEKPLFTIITTHYDNLAEHENVTHLQVVGLANIDYSKLKEELDLSQKDGIEAVSKYMDYRLVEVKDRNQVPRDAINIARLMGLSEEILLEAEEIIRE